MSNTLPVLFAAILLVLHSPHGAAFISNRPIERTPTTLFLSGFDVSSLLYQEHEKMLVARGTFEGELMAHHQEGISPNVVKGAGGGGGFGGGSQKKGQFKDEAKAHAKVLRDNGVVRIDNVLPAALADEMRAFVDVLREDSEEQVGSGKLHRKARFADVLLKENRCDLTLPLNNQLVADCVSAVLQQSPVGATMANLLTKQALVYELSCLISDPGSNRQNIHPDTPCAAGEDAVLYTCFVALQDITIDMGPTTWMPATHTLECHEQFQNEQVNAGEEMSPKDALLKKGPVVLGLLPKGSCGIFDSRLLHCGGANQSLDKSRAVFYFSFKNPQVANAGNPGSIRPNLINQWTLNALDKELTKHSKGKSKVIVGGRDSFE